MKPKSLKNRLLVTLLLGALCIAIAVGMTAFVLTNQLLHEKAATLLETRCASEATQLNDILSGVEQSVQVASWYCRAELESAAALADPAYQAAYTTHLLEMMTIIAQNTPGVTAYYLRFAPELTVPTAGFFINRAPDSDTFLYTLPTDLSLYAEDDTEHVGWFWQARNAAQPIWMAPYLNRNTGLTIISYVVPVYDGSAFVGVVGMDVDFALLLQTVDGISLYENGYSYLTDAEGNVLSSTGSLRQHIDCIEATAPLVGGMQLVLHAPYLDVIRESFPIVLRSLLVFTILMGLFMLFIVHITNRIFRPLKALTGAVRQMESGNTDVAIAPGGDDEIGLLANAFRQMASQVNHRMNSVSELAYRDSLTGVKSRLAYVGAVARIDQQLPEYTDFGVLVMDANGLKSINDTFGHEAGNAFIRHIAQVVCDVFKHSPVFRFGGDEFVVLLEGRDLADRDALVRQLDESFAANPFPVEGQEIPCIIAREVAVFDAATDHAFSDVFVRADKMMYRHKRRLKGLED